MYDYDLERLQNLSHGERCYQHLIASLALFRGEVLKIKISGNRLNVVTDNGLEKDRFLDLVQKNFDIIPEHEITRWRYENEIFQK